MPFKVNMVYHTMRNLGSGYMGSTGLKNALEKRGSLDYVYDQIGDFPLDVPKLQSNPVFYIRGFLRGRMPLVSRAGNQFKATWNSESIFTRKGRPDTSTPMIQQNIEHFNMIFTSAESDLESYPIPTYFLPSWVDTTVFDDVCPPTNDDLCFPGSLDEREDIFSQDTRGLIKQKATEVRMDKLTQTVDYVKLICSHKMLVSLPGRCFNSMTGRAFEIMGCKRLAFIYLNKDTMFKHMKFFEDGIDCVYWSTMDELYEKYDYYKGLPDVCNTIALNGYNKVREFHNQDVRAEFIHKSIEKEYNKWLKEQDNIPDAINEVHSLLT